MKQWIFLCLARHLEELGEEKRASGIGNYHVKMFSRQNP